MKRLSARGRLLGLGGLAVALAAVGVTGWLTASDHRDSALLTNDAAADIADVYTFRSPSNPDNLVLVLTVSGFIPPAEASTTFFDPSVLYQWKIDKNGDAVEDLVIQAFATGSGRHQKMHFRGPVAPSKRDDDDRIKHRDEDEEEEGEDVDRIKHREEEEADEDEDRARVRRLRIPTVRVTTGPRPIIAARRGIKVFAGVRDDPFFFDLAQFRKIVGGLATSFNDPGTDAFAGTNVLALVIELPSSMLGGTKLGVWGTTSRRES